MCGIAGFFATSQSIESQDGAHILKHMTNSIAHRGPDADGFWSDAQDGVFLGHRRLSILDLSPAGAQPMTSHDGRYVIVFNGEIYNAPVLAKALEQGYGVSAWRGHSDTEILLEGFARLGVRKTLEQIKGMFAVALWDRRDKTLTLMRDHLGKKPLYYGEIGGALVFASELKALRVFAKARGVTLNINRRALAAYTRFGFIPAPLTIYDGVYKLPPAHIMTIGYNGATQPEAFWRLDMHASREAVNMERLHALLRDAVRGRMMADVPLGAFLSGGIDSSLVVALMQEQSDRPIKTYSIGFDNLAFDESRHAEKVAHHLGCDHTTYRVTARDTLDVVPRLAQIYDEPFADYSQIPTVVLCAKARQDTVVALAGDGGDEFFCGYARYFMLQKLLHMKDKIPAPLRSVLGGLLGMPSQGLYNTLGLGGKRIHSIAGQFLEPDFISCLLRTLSANPDPARLVGADYDFESMRALCAYTNLASLEKMMAVDAALYLPDDILVKVDRASMAASLEVRAPLLDKDVIEYAWRIRLEDKLRGNGAGKKPLYDLLCTYVPEEMINRPKQGFTPPVAQWLRGELKDWAYAHITADTGLFNSAQVLKMWDEFQSGKYDHHNAIWSVVMAQSWHSEIA